MVEKLINKTKEQDVAEEVVLAESMSQRMVGLMFQKDFPENQTMWIQKCNWIHTFFMKFPIDVIFVDKNLVVKKVKRNISPWRLPGPVLSATSVFEFTAGQVQDNIEVGDQLYVGT